MSFFKTTFDLIKSVLPWSSEAEYIQSDGYSTTRHGYQADWQTASNLYGGVVRESELWAEQGSDSKKRKFANEGDGLTYKRARADEGLYPHESGHASTRNDGMYEPNDILHTHQRTDRDLMPPPMVRHVRQASQQSRNSRKRESLESVGDHSEARSHRTGVADFENEYDMESARRRAAATQLPPNSGTWEPAEQDLFFHLAYRGFEPLLSNTWMTDFPTLPLSLFAVHADQTPLIKPHRSTEFRAIKALRELIDTGKVVRDRTLASSPGLRTEPIIEKAAKKYIKWSLNDIGVSSKQCVPLHTIVSMKQGQTTRDTVRELTLKMHKLSARHREECNILTSIEKEEADSRAGETYLNEDPAPSEHKLPVIYGLMICSSLIAVFTLNSHTPPPTFVVRAHRKKIRQQSRPDKAVAVAGIQDESEQDQDPINVDDEDEDSGLRFISSFDFSNSTTDVWNAFVIAIVAMMVRKSLVEVYEVPLVDGGLEDEESVMEDSSLIDDSVLGQRRYAARYAVGQKD